MSISTNRFLRILFCCCFLPAFCIAQFRGGNDDGTGFGSGSNQPLGRNIYRGGNDDGTSFALGSNQPFGRNIFKGGNDDGTNFALGSNQPFGRNIFKGGNDDGTSFALGSNQSLGRNIFRGGNDDGVDFAVGGSQPLGRNIYTGGVNDGWAMSFAPGIWLPITLADFTGKWQNNDALLSWKTLTEINSDHFELERSFDGSGYTTIKTVTAAGQSNAPRSYNYTDAGVRQLFPAGTTAVYYRLRSVDKDGKFAYSGVVILKAVTANVTQYAVFPNPAKDYIIVNSNGLLPDNSTTIRLADITGKVLLVQKMTSDRQQLSVSSYIAGTYFLQVLSDNKVVYTQKIIIQK